MNYLYTIGHSQYTFEYFSKLLEMHNINYVIDVRSTPYSRFASVFDRENIKKELSCKQIEYAFLGEYFGARPKYMSLYSEDGGYLDFKKVQASDKFKRGMDNLFIGMQKENRIALMCTEKKPIECHRAIMVGNAFYKSGIGVNHILEKGNIQTHEELEKELLDIYFPERNQYSLIGNMTEDEYLEEAYLLRTKDIGYHLKERAVV